MRSLARPFIVLLAASCTGTIDTTLVGPVCGDAIVNASEACDTRGESQTCNSDCTLPSCGDGRVNARFTPPGAASTEECDDGGTANGDGCSASCQLEPPAVDEPRCGDGVVHADESCDTSNDSATCDFDCTPPVCGDGHVNKSFTPAGAPAVEHCDDGGTLDGDGCSALCQFESCGNATTDGAEGCDDGNDDDLDACRNDCTLHVCGDGVDSTAEVCDTGNDSATCDRDCSAPACGDGHVNRAFTPVGGTVAEQCDDGGSADGDGCSALCVIETCGNSLTETENGEACDDGNNVDDDACRNNCQLPRCGDGVVNALEACDSGGANTASCDYDCTLPACGDGVLNRAFDQPGAPGFELCDDGDTSDGDGCSATCQLETCGNGVTDGANGEQCDDANADVTDGCNNQCQLARCGDSAVWAGVEACDSGGANTAGCDYDCTAPECNDGVVNLAAGEECDDANGDGSDGCSACRLAFIQVPTVVDWGSVTVGVSGGLRSVPVFNPSPSETTGPIDVIIDGSSDFTIDPSTTCGVGLAPFAACTVYFDFVPGTAGPKSAQALVGTDGLGGRVSLFLQGDGL